jgi:hypothetical protein
VHEVVGEARRDVDVAAADAGTNTVLQVMVMNHDSCTAFIIQFDLLIIVNSRTYI